MKNINKIFLAIIVGAAIIGGCVYFGLQKPREIVRSDVAISKKSVEAGPLSNLCGAASNTIITKVIDVVEGGWHVRLLGIDADEKGYPCYNTAKTRLENLVLSKNVVLEKDVSDVDQYGRCLRYIFVGNTNIDVQLVAEGLAVARFYQPDIKYKSEITLAEKQAIAQKTGCKWK